MKISEAIQILKQMDPNKEVKLTFGDSNANPYSGERDYSDCQPGSTTPGESQSERFGR